MSNLMEFLRDYAIKGREYTMKLKLYQKNILLVLVIVVGGFILFNLAFLLAAFVINATIIVLGVTQNEAPPMVGRVLYLLLMFLISWFVFRSRLKDIIKATYLTMPLMIILVMGGISLYQQSKWVIAGIGAVIICAELSYLYKKKLSWLYYFSTFYVVVLALCIIFFNVQI
jgi:hypothetical protein